MAGVRMWSAAGAVASAVGPSIGGLLAQISWQWVFLINLPIGAVLLWFAVRHVRDTEHNPDATTPDFGGAVLFAASIGLLALGLVKSPEWGWGSFETIGVLAASAVLALIFVWRSRHHLSPVIDPALLKIRTFMWANAAMLLFNVAFAATMLIVVLWLQQVWGWSALLTGMAIAPGPAMVPITVALTSRFLPKVTPSRLVVLGSVLFGLGASIVALSIGTEPNYWTFLPGWVIGGIGVGFAMPNLMAGAAHDLPPTQTSTCSAIITMARQIGFVIGISVLFAIVGDKQGLDATESFRVAMWVSVVVLVFSALAGLGMASRRVRSAVAA